MDNYHRRPRSGGKEEVKIHAKTEWKTEFKSQAVANGTSKSISEERKSKMKMSRESSYIAKN